MTVDDASPLDSVAEQRFPAVQGTTGELADVVEHLRVEGMRCERCDLDQVALPRSRSTSGVATNEISADLAALS